MVHCLAVNAAKVTLRLAHNLWLVSVWGFSWETSIQQLLFLSLCLTLDCYSSLVLVHLLFICTYGIGTCIRIQARTGAGDDRGSSVERERGGSAQPQASEVSEASPKFGWHAHTDTCVARIHTCALTRTMKLPCRQSDNNSLASIHFLWEQSLLSSLFLSESLTVRARIHKHKDTHSHSRQMLLTLSTSASLFLFFFHLPCYWWIPDMTEPPSRLAPHGCLSASRQ